MTWALVFELAKILVPTIVSVVALSVAILTHRRNLRAQSQPVLVFTARAANKWVIENVGRGPAVYVLVGEADSSNRWHEVSNCYPLAAGGRLELNWLRYSYQLSAIYADVSGQEYTTHCIHNRNRIAARNEHPDWVPTVHEWTIRIEESTAGIRTLQWDDLRGLTSAELDKKRNEPLARVGYRFTNPTIASYFAQESWYVAKEKVDDLQTARNLLTAADRANMKFIAAYQARQSMTPMMESDTVNKSAADSASLERRRSDDPSSPPTKRPPVSLG